jgi:hypothetical protein
MSPFRTPGSRFFKREGFFYLAGICCFLLLFSMLFFSSSLARTWYIKADGSGDAPTPIKIIANEIIAHDIAIKLMNSAARINDNHIHLSVFGIDCIESSDAMIYSNRIHECGTLISATDSSVDPQFCGIYDSDNYYLQSDSPCAPGNHPDSTSCGLIGAFGINCSTVGITEATWGIIKNLYQGTAVDTLRSKQ